MLKIVENKKSSITYPVARRSPSNGFVVLFTSEREGVVVQVPNTSNYSVGYSSNVWQHSESSNWEPVSITIEG